MKQKKLASWLKIMIIGFAICAAIVYIFLIPSLGQTMVGTKPTKYEAYYWPWLIFLWGTALPFPISVAFTWKIASNIGNNKSFCKENAKLLEGISTLAFCDSAYFFFGNIVFVCLGMNHITILLLSIVIILLGIAISLATAALSHLVLKAAELQDQSDLTI